MNQQRYCVTRYVMLCIVLVAANFALAPAQVEAAAPAQQDPLILSYSAKFVCQEALEAGRYWYGPAAPIVMQTTEVLIHNPNAFPVTLYKKAVRAPLEKFGEPLQGDAPGKWYEVRLRPDYAFRIDCNDIAKLLSGDPAKNFFTPDGVYSHDEGFVVIGVGPQSAAGTNINRFPQLDVTAEYARSSEVMKKDINYRPWWRYWWWPLPWQLGYPYRQVIRLDAGTSPASHDVQRLVVTALQEEAQTIGDEAQRNATIAALDEGLKLPLEPSTNAGAEQPPALVAVVADPQFVNTANGASISVDYVLVSNRSPSDANPLSGQTEQAVAVRYPWIVGHWYDLPVVMAQNIHTDIHHYFTEWHVQQWISAGGAENAVRANMVYWFPYWCGWGYWWWGWRGSDCIDIGVGEGESLDVEQITPVRVFYPQWPPVAEQ